MEENSGSRKWYYAAWSKGKYLDLWSVNHTLAGCVIAGPLYALSVPLVYSYAMSMVLIVGWELYEIVNDIEETWQNRSTDIITGIVGFFFIWGFYPTWTRPTQYWVYLLVLFIWLILEVWGYLAYKVGKIR